MDEGELRNLESHLSKMIENFNRIERVHVLTNRLVTTTLNSDLCGFRRI